MSYKQRPYLVMLCNCLEERFYFRVGLWLHNKFLKSLRVTPVRLLDCGGCTTCLTNRDPLSIISYKFPEINEQI